MSAAALASSWATLRAPGMATMFGWCTTQARAICAGVAWWAAASSRRAWMTGSARRRFSSLNSRLAALTPPGALAAV